MKANKKVIVGLALALSLGFIGESFAEDIDSNDTQIDNPENKILSCSLVLKVENRNKKDWLKEGSKLVIDGKELPVIETDGADESVKLEAGKTYSIDVKDSKGNVYAKGEVSPSVGETGSFANYQVYLKLIDDDRTRVFNLDFYDKDLKETISLDGKYYAFSNGELIKYIDSKDFLKDFRGEMGKEYTIDIRRDRNPESELIYRGKIKMPKEGESLDDKSLKLGLTEANEIPEDERIYKKDTENEKTYKTREEAENAAKNELENNNDFDDFEIIEIEEGKFIYKLIKKEDSKSTYDTEEEAKEAAEKALASDDNYNSYKINKTEDGKYTFELIKKEDLPTDPTEKTYDTKKEAEDAARKALEENPTFKSFKIEEKDGKFYFVLLPEEEKIEEKIFDTEEEAKKAAEKALAANKNYNSYEIIVENGKYTYKLKKVDKPDVKPTDSKLYETEKEAKEAAIEALKGNEEYNSYKITKTDEGKYTYELINSDNIFKSEEEAKKAALKALESNKEYNAYDIITTEYGRYTYKLKKVNKPQINTEDPKLYNTKQEAEEAAKEALKNNKAYNSYEIKEKDGKYYYVLTNKEKAKTPTKKVTTKAKKSSNVKTGVGSLSGVVGIFLASSLGMHFSRRKK